MKIPSPMPYFDIKSTRAQMHIKSDPMRLRIERTPPKMRVNRVRPKMKVNWAKVRSQCGMRTPNAERQRMQRYYRQQLMQGIAKIVSTGDQIGNIQNAVPGQELVATVSLNQVMQDDIPVVDIASMPQDMPEIEWDQGSIEIEWEPGTLEMHWEGSVRPEVTVTPHTVEIRLINGETVRVSESKAQSLERKGYGKRLDESI